MLSIHKGVAYIKRKLGHIPFDVFVAVIICLVGFASFTLGWIARSQQQTENITVKKLEFPHTETTQVLVGSINSDKFHYRWCGGAEQISPENRIYFSSQEEARNLGYTAAENCPGL